MSDEMTAVPSLTTESVPLGDVDNVEFRGGNLHLSRDGPSTSKSAVSQNSSMVTSTYTAKNLFSFKVIQLQQKFFQSVVIKYISAI